MPYSDLVTPDLHINRGVLRVMAQRRALDERAKRLQMGWRTPFVELRARETRRLIEMAASVIRAERARRAQMAKPQAERDIDALELELLRAEHGLAMPPDKQRAGSLRRRVEALRALAVPL